MEMWKCWFCLKKIAGVASLTLATGLIQYGQSKSGVTVFAPTIVDTAKEPTKKWDYDWDRRQPDENIDSHISTTQSGIQTQRTTIRRHLILIRHGQYNVDGDEGLTQLGNQQAKMAAIRLREYGYAYTTIVSSRMTRARETADIIKNILSPIEYEETDLLNEGAPVMPEPPVGGWNSDKDPFFEDSIRMEAGFRQYIHRADPSQMKDSYEIFVTHANVIRYFLCRALQLPPEAWLRMTLNHGSITWLTVYPSGYVTMDGYGDTGFMPVDKCTTYNYPGKVDE